MENVEKKEFFLYDMSRITDNEFIFVNVGWCNHGHPITVFKTNKVNNWVYFDDKTDKIRSFSFDAVECWGFHSFGWTSYDYIFFLNNEPIDIKNSKFAPTSDKLKEIKTKELEAEIERIEKLMKTKPTLLAKIDVIKSAEVEGLIKDDDIIKSSNEMGNKTSL